MHISVNCEFNDGGAWCKCPDVKRSLLGMGARMCKVFEGEYCVHQIRHTKPKDLPPPPPQPKESKVVQDQITMARSLLNLRAEMEERGEMEFYYKINSCLYSKYPHHD